MKCDICERAHHPKRLPFLCVVDARNALYEGRVENAKILIETEAIESQVNKVLSDNDASSTSSETQRPSRAYVESCASEEYKIRERTERIIASADKLRDEVAAAKKEIEERRAAIAKKRKAIKMTKYKWDREYEAMTQYKAALCMEVAKLYRLQKVRRVQPELLSASLSHITHLLFLASHYLSIRLPAEITLPHNDYPRPTIFSLSSSYQHGEVAFPGSSPIPPDPRDRQFANVPFPRPLFIDKTLTTLAKEDPATYNAFLEAVCLLAYDIVWLCRTQGVPVGDNNNHFDNFTSIGRNMYNLLINSSLQRNPQQIADDVRSPVMANEGNEPTELGKGAPRMGLYSHAANPIKLMDKLKSKLTQEAPIPEWEVLDDYAWAPEDGDDGVFVGGTRPNAKFGDRARYGFESYMSVNTVKSGGNGETHPGAFSGPGSTVRDHEREKNTNGWTKVKPR
ncbi:hypothetical protein NPX13_g1930 [Xylaria arbuscula]|uniref:Autophagy-related protein 14 n=1 Tax=Xylaria arbuscula TaxID=114810 RepID=A0A9W8NKR3_9PEZI|nr:hypothetical protein NPX13_g1930 [Xylaria arbuscula]